MNPLSPPTIQGYFWLPNNQDQKIPGRLHCTDDGRLELEVLGFFAGAKIDFGQSDVSRILGISSEGQAITLEGCFYSKRDFNLSGFHLAKIHVNMALVGCHFEKEEPICFDEIACYSEAINDWLEFAPIESSLTTSPPHGVTLSFCQPPPVEWAMPNGVKMKVRSDWATKIGRQHRKAQITQKTWVSFDFDRDVTIDELLTTVGRFSHFVSLAVDQSIPPNAIRVYSKNLVEEIGEEKHRTPVQVFYAPGIRTSPNLARVAPPFSFFSFPVVRLRFGEAIAAWFENYGKFDSPFNLYFATKTGRDLYLGNRFLMLAQAVESLHRHSSSNTSFPQEKYEKLCELLRAAIPEEFKGWLSPRLQYGNEPSLRQRLNLMLSEFEPMYGDTGKRKNLISKIVNTRNYLTHYSENLREQAASKRELWKLCVVLETVLQLHMALMCGFSREEVIGLCRGSQSFSKKLANI